MTHKIKRAISALFAKLPFAEQCLHAAVIIWVLTQFISSAFMTVKGEMPIDQLAWFNFIHIYSGAGLFVLALIFSAVVIKRRKLMDLYPWAFGRTKIIKADIKTLCAFKLPKARAAGLAASIEGLGILALWLALVTGALWYLYSTTYGPSPLLLNAHRLLVTFIQVYFIGHGAMALLHFVGYLKK